MKGGKEVERRKGADRQADRKEGRNEGRKKERKNTLTVTMCVLAQTTRIVTSK